MSSHLHREKRKRSLFEYKHSPEVRAKMSAALMGHVSWNKGLMRGPLSAETRAKISSRLMGNKNTLGRVCTLAHRAKTSASLLGHTHSEETRAKIRLALIGRSPSEFTKMKISVAKMGVSKSMATRERMRAAQLTPKAAEARAKMCRRRGPTSIELAVRAVLDMLGEDYIFQHQIGRYVVDFYLPHRNIVLEADGAYWHSLPKVAARDEMRDVRMRELGYKIVRLTENEIKTNALVAVQGAI